MAPGHRTGTRKRSHLRLSFCLSRQTRSPIELVVYLIYSVHLSVSPQPRLPINSFRPPKSISDHSVLFHLSLHFPSLCFLFPFMPFISVSFLLLSVLSKKFKTKKKFFIYKQVFFSIYIYSAISTSPPFSASPSPATSTSFPASLSTICFSAEMLDLH